VYPVELDSFQQLDLINVQDVQKKIHTQWQKITMTRVVVDIVTSQFL